MPAPGLKGPFFSFWLASSSVQYDMIMNLWPRYTLCGSVTVSEQRYTDVKELFDEFTL